VLALLNETGGTLGGETSGHILCLDKTTTGDGLISALQVLAVMKQTGAGSPSSPPRCPSIRRCCSTCEVARASIPWPIPRVRAVVAAVERRFEGRGRIVLRASGTEPLIRVMVEGYDAALVKKGAPISRAVVEAAAKGRG
jgi:phosphoglucosamine mutase